MVDWNIWFLFFCINRADRLKLIFIDIDRLHSDTDLGYSKWNTATNKRKMKTEQISYIHRRCDSDYRISVCA